MDECRKNREKEKKEMKKARDRKYQETKIEDSSE